MENDEDAAPGEVFPSLFSSESDEAEEPPSSSSADVSSASSKKRKPQRSEVASRLLSSRGRKRRKPQGWSSMSSANKAAAMKTFAEVYGKNNISNKLACITEKATNALRALEINIQNTRDNAQVLENGFETDPSLKNADKRFVDAFRSLYKSLDVVAGKPLQDISAFVRHDVQNIHQIEEENDNFTRTVGQQCEDIALAYPYVPPKFMFNANLFGRHASSRAKGRKGGKKKGRGGRSSGRRGSGGQGSRSAGSRTRKTTGLRPLMSEIIQFYMRTSS